MIPLQSRISKSDKSSHIDLLLTPTSEPETSLPSSITTLNKRSKRSRFDFKKTLQRSKSMCVTQFNSWLQRRRQPPSQPRRKSAIDPKTNKEIISSPCSTPKLLGSPRLARLHQRIFKQPPSPVEPSPPTELPLLSSSPFSDDSDQHFQKQEPLVRIYLPARTSPTTRHVRITDINITTTTNTKSPPMSKIASPIIRRRNLSTSIKTTEERRESYTNIVDDK